MKTELFEKLRDKSMRENKLNSTAILLCGGVGRRMNAEIPKQFLEVKEIPIIVYTMKAIESAACIRQFVAVVHADWKEYLQTLIEKFGIRKCIGIVDGGNSRLYSTLNGVSFLENMLSGDELITVMDGIRPLVTSDILEDSIRVANHYDAALAVDHCYDTMYSSQDGTIVDSLVDRDKTFKGQTPETLKIADALKVMRWLKDIGIEDMSISNAMFKCGKTVGMSYGNVKNLKITTREDLELFEAILNLN